MLAFDNNKNQYVVNDGSASVLELHFVQPLEVIGYAQLDLSTEANRAMVFQRQNLPVDKTVDLKCSKYFGSQI